MRDRFPRKFDVQTSYKPSNYVLEQIFVWTSNFLGQPITSILPSTEELYCFIISSQSLTSAIFDSGAFGRFFFWPRWTRTTRAVACRWDIHVPYFSYQSYSENRRLFRFPSLHNPLHRYRRGHGFDSRSSLNFYRFLVFNRLGWKTFAAMIYI